MPILEMPVQESQQGVPVRRRERVSGSQGLTADSAQLTGTNAGHVACDT